MTEQQLSKVRSHQTSCCRMGHCWKTVVRSLL